MKKFEKVEKLGFLGLILRFSNLNVLHKGLLMQDWVFDKMSKGMLIVDHYRERAGGIFSMITFLKSVGSTDQNAL